ncbi:hypothetical protein ENSA5_01760 [Enhygromyxa salina]|uniref:Uncharacterized protein n=1 Tax=Enhygromyxa salina TaxID=215803 RepID=A0A2S9YLE1_9BACT|nr:hypothetical protein [Enhygromyxa salina]PRQ05856.1 hypothetical protein ENSA5_01760 [Enhygromyxa salina]
MATFTWSPKTFDEAVAALHDFCSHNKRALHELLRHIGAVPVPPPASDPGARLVAVNQEGDPRCAVIVFDADRESEYPIQAFGPDGAKIEGAEPS